MLDLKKAYPRVNKPAHRMIFERYRLKIRCLETVINLHETTEYKVRGRKGVSVAWNFTRGLREGCLTSPILFNVHHQAVVRQAIEQRRSVNEATEIVWKWIPRGTFAGKSEGEKECSEAKDVQITSVLFAANISVVAQKGEMDECVRVTNDAMGEWEK